MILPKPIHPDKQWPRRFTALMLKRPDRACDGEHPTNANSSAWRRISHDQKCVQSNEG